MKTVEFLQLLGEKLPNGTVKSCEITLKIDNYNITATKEVGNNAVSVNINESMEVLL